MQTQTILNFNEDINIGSIIKAAIKIKFDLIYTAAKEKDPIPLAKIQEEYFANEINNFAHAFSIHVDGHTPLSLLAFQGDYESVEFLLTKNVGNLQEALMGCIHRNDRPKLLTLSLVSFSSDFYYLLIAERIAIYLNDNQNELADLILNKMMIGKHTIPIYVEAMFGNVEKINSLVQQNTGNFSKSYINENILPHIAFCYGYKGHKEASHVRYLYGNSKERASLVRGCLEGGHIKLAEDLLQSWQQGCGYLLNASYVLRFPPPSNLLYLDIYFMVLSYINSDALRMRAFGAVLLNINQEASQLISSCNKLLDSSCIVNRYYQNYHLDFYHSLVCSRKETIGWFFVGMKLVKEGKLLPDLLINILSFTVSPKLSQVELTALFEKIYFAINKSFFHDDLDHHLARLYDKNRYYNKIEKIKNKCLEVGSLQELKGLLQKHYNGFFQKTSKTISVGKGEEHVSDQGQTEDQDPEKLLKQKQHEEEFGAILKKHMGRL